MQADVVGNVFLRIGCDFKRLGYGEQVGGRVGLGNAGGGLFEYRFWAPAPGRGNAGGGFPDCIWATADAGGR